MSLCVVRPSHVAVCGEAITCRGVCAVPKQVTDASNEATLLELQGRSLANVLGTFHTRLLHAKHTKEELERYQVSWDGVPGKVRRGRGTGGGWGGQIGIGGGRCNGSFRFRLTYFLA